MLRQGIRAIIYAFLLCFMSVLPVKAELADETTGQVQAEISGNTIAVVVNSSQILRSYGVQKVAVANPEIADVMVISGNEIMVVGKAPGRTSLHVWNWQGRTSYVVEVAADDAPIANEIRKILGIDGVRVSKVGKTVIIEGRVADKYQKLRAEKIASAYGEKVVNLLEITQPVQVKIEAKVIEISKSKTKDLGIKWGNDTSAPGSFRFGQTPMDDTITYPSYWAGNYDNNGHKVFEKITGRTWNNADAGTNFGQTLGKLGGYWDINAELNALVKTGAAKVLSQPYLVTVSGESANILVGGEIPIPVSSQNGSVSVEWKEYGIKLNIEPEVNADGLINGKIKAEVSALDWSSAHQVVLSSNLKIPPLTVRKAESVIALASGQTMAIGGLYASTESRSVIKLPLLGDLPILGSLFKSKSFSRDETELIILLTPTVLDPKDYVPQLSPDANDVSNWKAEKEKAEREQAIKEQTKKEEIKRSKH